MRKTIVVTGGAGFIGSVYIQYLLREYPTYRVICMDKLTYAGSMDALREAMKTPNFRFVRADVCDRDAVFGLFEEERPNFAVNFAAETHVDRSIENPTAFLQTNLLGTQTLMDACLRYETERYHQVSTDEVYGDLSLDRSGAAFTEESPLRPSSPYSASKAGADLMTLAYYRTYGLPITISRCSNNYGPNQFPEKLIPRMIGRAMKNERLPVYGDGRNVRDWLYVEDHVRAIDLILHRGRAGRTYNVGGGCEMSNIELVRMICRLLGKSDELICFVEDRKGHDLRYAVDSSRIRDELGWRPEICFQEGIQRTIAWYKQNQTRFPACF